MLWCGFLGRGGEAKAQRYIFVMCRNVVHPSKVAWYSSARLKPRTTVMNIVWDG